MGARAHKSVVQAETEHGRADAEFLKAIGERVRSARARKNITRKMLAERSDVSERYLALLESGRGNVSVLLLRQVGAALNIPADELLRDSDAEKSELGLIQQLLRGMNPQRLARVRDVLLNDMRAAPTDRSKRIALIGLRGSGKSTLGLGLARKLKRPFIELDREIEREAGTSLSEIFLLYGQQGYRRYERRCLEDLLKTQDKCVIATGGSIVSERATYDLLLSTCYTVWLKASPEEHMERVIAQGDTRPMAGNAQAMDDLRRILDSRVSLYGQADAIIDTAGKSASKSLSEINQLILAITQAKK